MRAPREEIPSGAFYERIIKEFPPQTAEEERAMIAEWKDRDRGHLNDLLVYHNIRLVYLYEKRYAYHAVFRYKDRDDDIQDGLVGLYKAAQAFDPDAGVRFASYAGYYVRRGMQYDTVLTLCRSERMIGLSLNERLVAGKRHDEDMATVDAFVGQGGLFQPMNRERPEIEYLVDRLDAGSALAALRDGVRNLTEREADVIQSYAGGATYREIGAVYGVSHERVRQLVNKARRKILSKTAAIEAVFGYGPSSTRVVTAYDRIVEQKRRKVYKKNDRLLTVEWRISGGGGAYFWELQDGESENVLPLGKFTTTTVRGRASNAGSDVTVAERSEIPVVRHAAAPEPRDINRSVKCGRRVIRYIDGRWQFVDADSGEGEKSDYAVARVTAK